MNNIPTNLKLDKTLLKYKFDFGLISSGTPFYLGHIYFYFCMIIDKVLRTEMKIVIIKILKKKVRNCIDGNMAYIEYQQIITVIN